MSRLDETLGIIDNIRTGCPCDRIKTYKGVIRDLKEEIKEIELALESNDVDNFKEELGDVLFNVLMMIRIGKDEHGIDLDEILAKINNKMTFRHPHVFEEKRDVDCKEATDIWMERKRIEKEENIKH